jgi:hypothetical protein
MAEIPRTRASLLLRLRNPHDDDAWREFVDLYAPIAYGYARLTDTSNRMFHAAARRDGQLAATAESNRLSPGHALEVAAVPPW